MARTSNGAEPDIVWPEAKRFAFTIFDDTDLQTVDNVKPVYDLLGELGLRTTKSVWPIAGSRPAKIDGATCANPRYREWTTELEAEGFEIGLHNATYHTSKREGTQRGLREFRATYGHAPRVHANHYRNREGIYWGEARLSGWRRMAYRSLARLRGRDRFEGHLESSPLFWGDLCRDTVTYVRNFVFDDINTLRACPVMPYVDPERPYVRRWFASSDGGTAPAFLHTLREENQDRLEEEGGVCIMYTHFAYGFVEDGRVLPRFVKLMERLAEKDGWFAPVSVVLDHMVAQRGEHVISPRERAELEQRWLMGKVRSRLKLGASS